MNGPTAQMSIAEAAKSATLSEVVHRRAAIDGERIAYTFLADGAADARSITWAQLDRRASELGASLREQGGAGQTVLLALPSGLAFVESLFACWYAGAIAVPISLPRHQRVKHRLHRIVADAGARFAIGSVDTRARLNIEEAERAATAGITWLDPDAGKMPASATIDFHVPSQSTALLQYTSGSTGSPRGVIVTHKNLMRNSALIAQAGDNGPGETLASWLPLFHDMGLVGIVLQGAFSGARCVFMSPERFLMRPWLWLQMISDYKAFSSPAPNFAYDLCVEKISPEQKAKLDLSCWRNAMNGSEPVRPATLERFASAFACCGFRREAFFPCYGLAEATLFVTGPGRDRAWVRRTPTGDLLATGEAGGHLGCGRTFGDTQLAIVDPKTARRVAPGEIGEIWVAGESCAAGYWNNPEATTATFNARLDAPTETSETETAWLRTGDLGFIADGQLFITGRLRELIIIYGRNYFPHDLELTVEAADPVIASSAAVAFSVDVDGVERLIIAAEVRREYTRPIRGQTPIELDLDILRRKLRAAVVNEHEVAPHEVVLLHPGALPRTTSGKLSRGAARDAYLNQTLDRLESASYVHANT